MRRDRLSTDCDEQQEQAKRLESTQVDDRAQTEAEATVVSSDEDSALQTQIAHDELVREGRRRAAIWGVLTGLAMTVVALGCILLLYLALGR